MANFFPSVTALKESLAKQLFFWYPRFLIREFRKTDLESEGGGIMENIDRLPMWWVIKEFSKNGESQGSRAFE